jgi:hypothetical protein
MKKYPETKIKPDYSNFVLNKNMETYRNHPYFIKKAEKAKESLLRMGGMPAILLAFGIETCPEEKSDI